MFHRTPAFLFPLLALVALLATACIGPPPAAQETQAFTDGLVTLRAAYRNERALCTHLIDEAAVRGAPADAVAKWRAADAENTDAFTKVYAAELQAQVERGKLTFEQATQLLQGTSEEIRLWKAAKKGGGQ